MRTFWRGSAVRTWGLLLGGALGILSAVNTLLLVAGVGGIGGLPQFVVVLAIFFAAGLLAARATGDVARGAMAGMLAAALATGLGGLVDVVLAVAAPHAYAFTANLDRLADRPDRLVLTVLFALVISLIEYAIFGGAAGAVGGLVSQRLAHGRAQTREPG